MRSRTDVAGLSCAVVSGRGGGLTCAAAVVVLYRQPRRACAPPGSGAEPRGVAGGRGRSDGRRTRRRPGRPRGPASKLRNNFPFCDPAGLSSGGTSQKVNFAASLWGRRDNGPPGPKVRRKVLGAGGPRPVGVGERGQGLATTDGLSMRAGVPSGTQGDGPGRWPPRTRRRAAGPGSVSLGGARRRGPPRTGRQQI